MIERRKTDRELDIIRKQWNDRHWAEKRANAVYERLLCDAAEARNR